MWRDPTDELIDLLERVVPMSTAPLVELRQRTAHPVARGLALHDPPAFPGSSPEVGEAQEIERRCDILGPWLAASMRLAEVHQPGLLRV